MTCQECQGSGRVRLNRNQYAIREWVERCDGCNGYGNLCDECQRGASVEPMGSLDLCEDCLRKVQQVQQESVGSAIGPSRLPN